MLKLCSYLRLRNAFNAVAIRYSFHVLVSGFCLNWATQEQRHSLVVGGFNLPSASNVRNRNSFAQCGDR